MNSPSSFVSFDEMSSSECLTTKLEPQSSCYGSVHSCNSCPYKTKSLFTMSLHLRQHLENPRAFNCSDRLEKHNCKSCSFRTHFITVFNEHLRRAHRSKKHKNVNPAPRSSYRCRKCPFRTVSRLMSLRHHVVCPMPKVPRSKFFKCDKCNLQTRFKNNLARHVKSQHAPPEKIKWYKCDQCDFQAKNHDNIKSHKISKHTAFTEIKWYRCDKCPYMAKKQSALTAHTMFQHTAYKDIIWYKCANCSFRSKKKFNLQVHLQSRH